MRFKETIVVLLLGVILSGCGGGSRPAYSCEDYYPELPDNDYCFRKIAEYNEYVNNPRNEEEMYGESDGIPVRVRGIIPPFSPEGYLGILLGRYAIERYLVYMPLEQGGMLLNLQKMPDCLVYVSMNPQIIGVEDYFNCHDDTHLRVMIFYYRTSDREKFQVWLRENIPVEKLPRWKKGDLL